MSIYFIWQFFNALAISSRNSRTFRLAIFSNFLSDEKLYHPRSEHINFSVLQDQISASGYPETTMLPFPTTQPNNNRR